MYDREMCAILLMGKPESQRRLYPSCIFAEGSSSPPDERKEGDTMYVTYQDLIQIGILIVALANLIYQIYKGKRK